jgi:hypothetical protein
MRQVQVPSREHYGCTETGDHEKDTLDRRSDGLMVRRQECEHESGCLHQNGGQSDDLPSSNPDFSP